jgi:hypothetical protein
MQMMLLDVVLVAFAVCDNIKYGNTFYQKQTSTLDGLSSEHMDIITGPLFTMKAGE